MEGKVLSSESILQQSFQDLDDALDDFRNADFMAAYTVLPRFMEVFDSEPLTGFVDSVLPKIPDDTAVLAWIEQLDKDGRLSWQRNERIGLPK
jgi:hypothetical protein